MMFIGDLKKTAEVKDQTQLDQVESEDSPGNINYIEGGEKSQKVNKERIERLKKAFKPSRLHGIVEIQDERNQRKKTTK